MSGVATVLNLLGLALITITLYAGLYVGYTGIDRFGYSGHARGAVRWLGLALFGLPLVVVGLADDRARCRRWGHA